MECMAATDKAQQELEQIERQVAEMESSDPDAATRRQIVVLQERIDTLRRELNAPPTAWQKTELARHPQRPQSLDYIERIFTDFSEIHGDRAYGDDAAIVTGMARFHGDEVLLVATQKGRDMKQRVFRNFGTPHPEGYRKAIRAMQIAEKFRRPIFTLVDTDGAYPGIHA
jgi:acetyl-CoA carboxylase carboxyl transferase subunit alpha